MTAAELRCRASVTWGAERVPTSYCLSDRLELFAVRRENEGCRRTLRKKDLTPRPILVFFVHLKSTEEIAEFASASVAGWTELMIFDFLSQASGSGMPLRIHG